MGAPVSEPSRPAPPSRAGAGIGAAVAVVALLVVVGGYGAHWSWIGVNGATATLWDWLRLILLPIAALALSLWLRHRPPLTGWRLVALSLGSAVFVLLILAGYLVPWAWTGFVGNTLWDWLNLAALPLAVALIPVLVELRPHWTRRHLALLTAGGAAFLALVLAGYLADWRWTGFTGNTAWDWLHLLLLPLLVPAVIVPMLRPAMVERFRQEGDEEGDEEEDEVEDVSS